MRARHENALVQMLRKICIHPENRADTTIVVGMRVPARRRAALLLKCCLIAPAMLSTISLMYFSSDASAALVIAFAQRRIKIEIGCNVLWRLICHGSNLHGGLVPVTAGLTALSSRSAASDCIAFSSHILAPCRRATAAAAS